MVKISCTGIGSGFSQFDGVEISGCTNAEFNKTTVIQELAADYIIIVGNLKETFTQDSGLKITRKTPDMDYICENGTGSGVAPAKTMKFTPVSWGTLRTGRHMRG